MNWDYLQPVKIKFGNGRIQELKQLAKELGYANGMLVSDKFFLTNGFADKLMAESEGVLTTVFGEVSPNPDVTEVDACARIIKEQNIGFLVALGGGSALDCAKAASVICLTDDSIRKYHGTNIPMPAGHLPLIAVPTTAGTGSEVTCVSVLTDHENGKKSPVVSNDFYPEYAIIDPLLTFSMPPKITAITGIDVLCHALEGYWSKGHQPICDVLALHAAGLVFEYLLKAYNNPEDAQAREKMAEASLIAGLAFTLPKTTASHACSFPLTNLYHIPHGEACGLTLDYFALINGKALNNRIDKFAVKLGFQDTADMATEIHQLKNRMGLRNDLKDLNLTEKQLDELVKISRHPNLYNNPVDITDQMLYDMYQSMT